MNIGRLIPLLITLVAVGVWGMWTYAPASVDAFSDWILENYMGRHLGRLDQLKAMARTDRESAIEGLEELISELSSYRRGDRLEEVARDASFFLSDLHENAGDHERAVEVMERCVAVDEKDLLARIRYLRNLSKLPDGLDKAVAGLQEWHAKFPGSLMFTELLAELLADAGRVDDAWDLHMVTFERARSNLWRVFWSRPDEEDLEQLHGMLFPRVDEDRMMLTYEMEGAATSIEMKLPTRGRLELRDLELTASHGDKTIAVGDFTTVGMDVDGTTLTMASNHAVVELRDLNGLKERMGVPSDAALTIHVEGRARWLPEPPMGLFAHKYRTELRLVADQRDDGEMRALVRDVAAGVFRASMMYLFWKREGNFNADQQQMQIVRGDPIEDGHGFEVRFPLVEEMTSIRLDFPELPGTRWSLQKLALELSDGRLLDLSDREPTALHAVEREGGITTVTDRDPYIVYDLDDMVQVQGVQVVGVILLSG